MTAVHMYTLRNQSDLDAIIEEVTAAYDKTNLYKLYRMATDDPFSYLYSELTTRNTHDRCYMTFDRQFVPN